MPLVHQTRRAFGALSIVAVALVAHPRYNQAQSASYAAHRAAITALARAFATRDTTGVAALLDPRFHIGPLTGAGASSTLARGIARPDPLVTALDVDSIVGGDTAVVAHVTSTSPRGRRSSAFIMSKDARFIEMGIFQITMNPGGPVTVPAGQTVVPLNGGGAVAPVPSPDAAAPSSVSDTALRKRLLRLGEWDQRHRGQMTKVGSSKTEASSPGALDSLQRLQSALDAAARDSLRAIVRESGWPGARKVGADAAIVAFLIVQHSPLDVQAEYLPMIERAVAAGDARGADLALLTDRMLMFQGKKQRYGSQLKASPGGPPELWPIEDEAHVDERRRAVGLQPLADYLKSFGIEWKPAAPPRADPTAR